MGGQLASHACQFTFSPRIENWQTIGDIRAIRGQFPVRFDHDYDYDYDQDLGAD